MSAPSSQIGKLLRTSPQRSTTSSKKSATSADAGVSFDDTLAQARAKPRPTPSHAASEPAKPDEKPTPAKDKARGDRQPSDATTTDNPQTTARDQCPTPEKTATQEASEDSAPTDAEHPDTPVATAQTSLTPENSESDTSESPTPDSQPSKGIPLPPASEEPAGKFRKPTPAPVPESSSPPAKTESTPTALHKKPDTKNASAPQEAPPESDTPSLRAASAKPAEPRLPRHLQAKENENHEESQNSDLSKKIANNEVSSITPGISRAEEPTLASALAQAIPDQYQPAPVKSEPTVLHPTPAPLPQDTTPRAESTTPAQETPKNTHENPFDQILLGLRGKFDAKNGRAEIRLDPPSLGTVHVSINLQNGVLTAQLQSDSAPVQELLKGNLDQLKNVLESQGVTVDKLVVNNTQERSALTMANSSLQTYADGRGSNSQSSDQRRPQPQADDEFTRIWNELNSAKKPLDLVA